ncbi:hypothetical protein LG003_21345 [Photorhabdus kleinii]|uniref:hypothetical protein n=1 Tax=Photorhabdus kleinii TaxID=768034 RepID=UPI0021D4BFC3|nr:hypothetical protein [Photorhabdus kleinii]MCT8345317.1 hypothetical protein [Photorhabdus kleinii]
MAYTYDNPGVWKSSTVVAKGNIFMVTPNDANNTIYHAGDFYTAQFDGSISNQYYPPHGESNSNWLYTERWDSVVDVSVVLFGSASNPTVLYGNGLCMVPVRVYMTPKDVNNKSFTVSDEEFANAVTLVDYATGKPYNKLLSPPKVGDEKTLKPGSYYCTTAGEYVLQSGMGVSNFSVGKQDIILYVLYKSDSIDTVKLQLGCIITPTGNPANTVKNSYGASGANPSGYINVLSKKKFTYGENADVFASLVSDNVAHGISYDKYYVHFPDNSEISHVTLIKSAITSYPCKPITDNCFYIKSVTGYIACGVFTDDKVHINKTSYSIPKIPYFGFGGICADFSNNDSSLIHEQYGVCVVLVREWLAGFRDTKEASSLHGDYNGGQMSIYDKYGNSCNLSFNYFEPNNKDAILDFKVI